MGNYNFTKFHQNQMKNKKSFINSLFFCSEFQSVSRIVKIIHSAMSIINYYLVKCFIKSLDPGVGASNFIPKIGFLQIFDAIFKLQGVKYGNALF